jgi:hypothetical protein
MLAQLRVSTLPQRLQSALQCTPIDACFTCTPPCGTSGCAPLKRYRRLTVSEHGRVAGRAAMKSEIYKRGPISCVIDATRGLDEYAGAPHANAVLIQTFVWLIGVTRGLDEYADARQLLYRREVCCRAPEVRST